ncbi:MAG: ABC transporter permease subunit [Planctomycetes bacterium]|nr:ABC transporter permease subunit [Planctomycetota bacterium]
MSSAIANLAVVCAVLAVLQVLAALPWLLALNPMSRSKLLGFRFLSKAIGVAVLAGVALAAYFGSNMDPQALKGWGRVYMAALQSQIAADLFVLVFLLLLRFWPKGGAVSLAAFQEGLRQPMFWLLAGAAVFLMMVSPFLPYFTFGEDLKMVKELCYAFAMLAPAAFGVIAATMSVSEEIEGRTAITLMSKPISRRQFLLGKFGGILLAALFMTCILGWCLVWVILFKQWYENPTFSPGSAYAEPAWVMELIDKLFPAGPSVELFKGVGFWINDALQALPGLIIGFCQVMVLVAVAVALATRLPMVVTVPACLFVYFLGNLTGIMTEATRNLALVHFVAQVFDTILPGLELFDVSKSISRDFPLPLDSYLLYAGNVSLYALTYTAIALLFGLVLFEDRDLA